MENSGISIEDYKAITEALIKASNLTETEWLNIEKSILETYPSSSSENVSSMVRDMWEQLHRKVQGSMERIGIRDDNKKNKCLEETITLKETGDTLTYSLSNSHLDIETAIYEKTGYKVPLSDIVPKINTGLSVTVKEMMNKHNVEFSMTTYLSNGILHVIINRHANGQWYFASFVEKDGKLYLVK